MGQKEDEVYFRNCWKTVNFERKLLRQSFTCSNFIELEIKLTPTTLAATVAGETEINKIHI